jgi:hypothetical protein
VRPSIPLRERRIDLVFIAFFIVNVGFITYIVDLEQLVIADPGNFHYPGWPPAVFVDLVHWWARNFDPLQWARPPWWCATIWIDVLFFGPFYVAAIYAFIRGRDWIRVPSFVWAGMMLSNVIIILFEETVGPHATPAWGTVAFANAAWLLMPLALIARLARSHHPFTRPA